MPSSMCCMPPYPPCCCICCWCCCEGEPDSDVDAALLSAPSAPPSILFSAPALLPALFFRLFFFFLPVEPPALGDCDWSDELGDSIGGEARGEPLGGGGLGEWVAIGAGILVAKVGPEAIPLIERDVAGGEIEGDGEE